MFAAYHELLAGEPVKEVVLDDGAGHKASTKGQQELADAGLINIAGDRAHITEDGEQVLASLLNAIRSASSLIRDKAQFEEHWVKDLDRWFPHGFDTPGIVLIKVAARSVEYWDGEENARIDMSFTDLLRMRRFEPSSI